MVQERSQLGSDVPDSEVRAALHVALAAAAEAEIELGELRGQLVEAKNEWAAACLAQEEWNELIAHHVEEVRLAREHQSNAEAELARVRSTTSWKLLQGALGPYRRVRHRLGSSE